MARDLKPHTLLDFLKKEYNLTSDGQLCKALGVTAPTISKIRARSNTVSASVIIIVHKKTGMAIEDIEEMLKESEIEPERIEV